jgi:hypothetical protein
VEEKMMQNSKEQQYNGQNLKKTERERERERESLHIQGIYKILPQEEQEQEDCPFLKQN